MILLYMHATFASRWFRTIFSLPYPVYNQIRPSRTKLHLIYQDSLSFVSTWDQFQVSRTLVASKLAERQLHARSLHGEACAGSVAHFTSLSQL
jgi:hypothetical protein